MVVIWKGKFGNTYVTPGNRLPSSQEMKLAEEYDIALRNKMAEIKERLEEKGFFKMKSGMKKWRMLGEELSFLDELQIRKDCDPDLENTWRAFYDIAPELSPTGKMPSEKERAEGRRNHFLICYYLAKVDWPTLGKINWRMFNDIYMSLTTSAMRSDINRLLEWIISRSTEKGKVNGKKIRKVLEAVRHISGEKSRGSIDTRFLERKELFDILDKELEEL
jgi:hypothetical protein